MSSIPSSGIGIPMNTSLPPPIPPPMPSLPMTSTPTPSILHPNHSSPLPPISTISNHDGSINPLKVSSSQTSGLIKPTVTGPSLHQNRSPKADSDKGGNIEANDNSDGFQPRLVLRVKTKRNNMETSESVTFEKQVFNHDISKNDSYCWVCHEGGEVLCCDKCPRVFHLQCSGLDTPPEDDAEWVCPVCKNISRKQKRSRPYGLKDLLLLAVQRMMFQGTEIFQKSVPEDLIEHYREYIFHPMHMGMIKERAARNEFQSTREFLHETEWILHNCIIYNGGKHALTKIAKGIVKICKEDMREIELCPSCYSLTVKQPINWFCIPCNPPHRVVLAKVRGYPLWPAKLISETTDKCDVRFFGQHDRSLVQRSCIQDLNGPPPTPTTKTAHWSIAMDELTKYRQNINQMVQQMASGKSAEKFINEKIEEAPKQQRIPSMTSLPPIPKKVQVKPPGRSQISGPPPPPPPPPMTTPVYNGYKEEQETRKNDFSISNHIPCSPQIVMVNPSFSDEDSTIHGNSASFPHSNDTSGSHSNPSSPGSDVGLRIDLEGSDLEQKRGDKCLAPNANHKIMNKKKTKSNPSEGYYDSTLGTSSMDVRMITPTAYRQPSNRPGQVLSLITDNLAEKRALELKGRGLSSGTTITSGGGIQEEDVMMVGAFSSVYPRDKLAIAVVDLDAKRIRDPKRKKRNEWSPVKRSKRIKNIDNATPPPSNHYDSHNYLITGSDSFETNGFVPSSSSQVYSEMIEEVPPLQLGEGLLADTIRNVDTSYGARLDGLIGRRDDMGYQYFSEKMMSSIKTVVNEMLSIFETKGKMGAKQIKEQLHTAWPVPDSRSQLESLKRELQNEMRQSLELVKSNAEVEREQIVRAVRGQVEAEKELAILETKKKKWCSYCFQEAIYNCCWNANYCNESCQQAHWEEHSTVCMQVNNQIQPGPFNPPASRHPSVSTDSQKMISPVTMETNPTSFSFVNNAESSSNEDDRPGRSSNHPQSNQHHYNDEVYSETSMGYDDSHEYHDNNVMSIIVPEQEIFTVNQQEIDKHTIHIEHITNNTSSSLLLQSASPIITQTAHPHHIIPVSSTSLQLPPLPISPTTPPHVSSDHPPSVLHMTNTFSWPYQQQTMTQMSHDFSQTLPLLPQVPALTPTTQSNTFFRVF